ncbi:MAG TPA: hypothetical protein VJB35_02215 [Candidatus Nanoarchaeia archaeon]|nr:hypothetical protein [Candidatus Nanoarchaeia archaeon]
MKRIKNIHLKQLEQEFNSNCIEDEIRITPLKGGLENFVLDHELMYIGESNRAGWDYLYEHCFEDINQIVEENVNGYEHPVELVENVYQKMLESLEKAKIKMDQLEGDKDSWYNTYNVILEFSKKAETTSLRVITINMIDQHLRSTY